MANILTVKLLLNFTISTEGAEFMTININNFYLNTPLKIFEYLRLKLDNLLEYVIKQYKLNENSTHNG